MHGEDRSYTSLWIVTYNCAHSLILHRCLTQLQYEREGGDHNGEKRVKKTKNYKKKLIYACYCFKKNFHTSTARCSTVGCSHLGEKNRLKSHEAQRLANRHGHFAAVARRKSNEQRLLSDRDLQRVLWKGKHQGLPKFNLVAVALSIIYIYSNVSIYEYAITSNFTCMFIYPTYLYIVILSYSFILRCLMAQWHYTYITYIVLYRMGTSGSTSLSNCTSCGSPRLCM